MRCPIAFYAVPTHRKLRWHYMLTIGNHVRKAIGRYQGSIHKVWSVNLAEQPLECIDDAHDSICVTAKKIVSYKVQF